MAPGELGGMGMSEALRVAAEPAGEAEPRPLGDAAADALLSEILPETVAADTALSGPLSTGVGVLPGPGTGGGGGSGGGSGGGVGRGVGPSTEFFGARERAGSFVYVIDRSGSMTGHSALRNAKRELQASLSQLPPDAKFGVIFYNLDSIVMDDAQGRPRMMPATAANKERVISLLAGIDSLGGTDHVEALEAALAMKPEVIFFLTDAKLMTAEQAETLRAEAGTIRIQAIEFGVGPDPRTENPLRTLAIATGGAYRYIDVTRYEPLAE